MNRPSQLRSRRTTSLIASLRLVARSIHSDQAESHSVASRRRRNAYSILAKRMADCPKCKLSLQPQLYEDVTIQFCGNCWGHWLDHPSMAQILATEAYGFSRSEQAVVLESWVKAAESSTDSDMHGLRCPICQAPMTESVFADDCPVLVDRCSQHGTWLDAGEIKQVQIFVENRRR